MFINPSLLGYAVAQLVEDKSRKILIRFPKGSLKFFIDLIFPAEL
jgi:hypothetical protein